MSFRIKCFKKTGILLKILCNSILIFFFFRQIKSKFNRRLGFEIFKKKY